MSRFLRFFILFKIKESNLQALIIVMPILGIGYLVTMVGPDATIPWAHNTFQVIRCVLLSTQVRVIS